MKRLEQGYRITNELPPGFFLDYEPFIFQQPDHLVLQVDTWLHFYLLRDDPQKVMAQISFYLEGGVASSPFRAPFGSYSYSEKLSPPILYEFVRQVETELRTKDVTSVKMVEPPLFYRPSGALLQTILFNLGYQVSRAEVSSGIEIDSTGFEDKIDSWEKRKLRMSLSKDMVFKQIPVSELPMIYNLILQSRNEKGYSLSMTLKDLTKTVDALPDSFLIFATFLEKEIASASIAIRVQSGIIYNFYSAHHSKFDEVSPVVLLMNGMYDYCQQHDIRLLDLGTSALEDQPNFPLLDFKLRLGSIPSMKLTFEKKLS